MRYVIKALVTGKCSFGRKVLHLVTAIAAVMLFLNSPEWGGKCWFGLCLPILACCILTSQQEKQTALRGSVHAGFKLLQFVL